MTRQTINIVAAIKSVPYGCVATYGQIAQMMGYPKGARQVSWTLRTQTHKHQLPWHRIIGGQGKITTRNEGFDLQKALLEQEGVLVIGDKIDLKQYQWSVDKDDLTRIKEMADVFWSDAGC